MADRLYLITHQLIFHIIIYNRLNFKMFSSTNSSYQFNSPGAEIEHFLQPANSRHLLCLSPDNPLSQIDEGEAIAESVH